LKGTALRAGLLVTPQLNGGPARRAVKKPLVHAPPQVKRLPLLRLHDGVDGKVPWILLSTPLIRR